jgi:hypothetical protein
MNPVRRHALGDAVPFSLVIDTDESGQPWASFAGYAVRFTVRKEPDQAALIALTNSPGGAISTGVSAHWELQTESLRVHGPGRFYYDVEIQNQAAGRGPLTLESGLLILTQDITTL